MKALLAIMLFFTSSASVMAGIEEFRENLDLGVSLLGSKSDNEDDFDVTGVVLIDYDGFKFELIDNVSLNLIPTSAEIGLTNGTKTRVYTDMATLQYYGEDNLVAMISAISVDYDHFDNFSIKRNKKIAIAEAEVTKFIPLGRIELDVTGKAAFGGKTSTRTELREGVNDSVKATHYYTVEGMSGVAMPVNDTIDLYLYGGAYYQDGEAYDEIGTYVGADLKLFDHGTSTSSLFFEFNNINRDYVTVPAGTDDNFNDNIWRVGLRVNFW